MCCTFSTEKLISSQNFDVLPELFPKIKFTTQILHLLTKNLPTKRRLSDDFADSQQLSGQFALPSPPPRGHWLLKGCFAHYIINVSCGSDNEWSRSVQRWSGEGDRMQISPWRTGAVLLRRLRNLCLRALYVPRTSRYLLDTALYDPYTTPDNVVTYELIPLRTVVLQRTSRCVSTSCNNCVQRRF